MEVTFLADNKRIAILSYFYVTIYDIMYSKNHLSFDPGPKEEESRIERSSSKHVVTWLYVLCYKTLTQMRSQDYSRFGN